MDGVRLDSMAGRHVRVWVGSLAGRDLGGCDFVYFVYGMDGKAVSDAE